MRFQKLNCSRKLIRQIIDKLLEIGFKEVPNKTYGDEDFLMIDELRKEFIWCENGFAPFCSDTEMRKYQFLDANEVSLKELENKRR